MGIFDAEGHLLGQAPGLPFFLGSLGGTLREVIRIKGYEVFRGRGCLDRQRFDDRREPPERCDRIRSDLRGRKPAGIHGCQGPLETTSGPRMPVSPVTPRTSSRRVCGSDRPASSGTAASTSRSWT